MILTALGAMPLTMIRRPESVVLVAEVLVVSLAGATWWRSRGRSALLGGLVAGLAAMLVFETFEVAYHRTLTGLDPATVARLLNAAAAPLAGAMLGGLVGLAVAFVGRLADRARPRSACQSMGSDREEPHGMGRQDPEQEGRRDEHDNQEQGAMTHEALGSIV